MERKKIIKLQNSNFNSAIKVSLEGWRTWQGQFASEHVSQFHLSHDKDGYINQFLGVCLEKVFIFEPIVHFEVIFTLESLSDRRIFMCVWVTTILWWHEFIHIWLFIYCQTPGLVLSLRVDFILPLSQEEEQQQQPEPSPYVWINISVTKAWIFINFYLVVN